MGLKLQYWRAKRIIGNFVLWYLRSIARLAISQTRATIIGVAGSVGKTSTREAIFAILKDIALTHMVAGNSETGVPLGLVGLFPSDYSPLDWARMLISAPFRIGYLKKMRYIIVEMGIDDPYPPKNMEYLLSIVRPQVGIITDESAAHTMQFEKIFGPNVVVSDRTRLKLLIEAITKEDAKMLENCELRIINGDNPVLTNELPGALTFGTKKSAVIRITGYKVSTKQTEYSFTLDGKSVTLRFKRYAFPKELGFSVAASILAAYKLNIPLDIIQEKLEKNFVPPKGRESLFQGIHESVIIDSSYNASRPSVLSFLTLTNKLKEQSRRHTIVVLADMLELGNESQIEHEAVASAIGTIPDDLFLVGPLTKRFILPKFPNAKWFPSVIELNQALSRIPHHSLILFKGSQGDLWLEESIKPLLKNKEDVHRLCRQYPFWKRVKKAAGRWIEV